MSREQINNFSLKFDEIGEHRTRNKSVRGTLIKLQVHKGKLRFEAKHKWENNK